MVRFMLLRNMDDLIDLEQVRKAGGRRACKEIFRDRNNHLIDMYDNVDFPNVLGKQGEQFQTYCSHRRRS